MPVLSYIYRDLVRLGLRDHLKGVVNGLSEEITSFSTHLMYYLGKIYFVSIKFLWIFLGVAVSDVPPVRVEFARRGSLTGIRSFDVEPGLSFWDDELSFHNRPSASRVQLVSV